MIDEPENICWISDGAKLSHQGIVRKDDESYDKIGEVPEQLRKRMLAVRAFDGLGIMLAFELVDGRALE